jgi:hypothetical protein
MKINESNALTVASIGAALWWLVFGVPPLLEFLFGIKGGKNSFLAISMLFGGCCGLAFYAFLMVDMIKATRILFRSAPVTTLLISAWSMLPLVPISASLVVIIIHIAKTDYAR